MPTREELIFRTFVDVADTLVADFDVVDFLNLLTRRCVELFDTAQAGLMLVDDQGGLQLAASSSGSMRDLELFEVQHDEGPCVDSFRSGSAVACEDLADDLDRWPRFSPEAVRMGFRSAYALPMRLRDRTIGSLNLLRHDPGPVDDGDLSAMQALADVATIGLLQQRAADDARLLADQLQHALESRVVIEQAKGVLAQHAGLPMDAAFEALRGYSRSTSQRLSDVARAVTARTVPLDDVAAPRSLDRDR
jgi:GAF domain-containing protein